MRDDEIVFQIRNFLSAYDRRLVREALKQLLLSEREEQRKAALELERRMKEEGNWTKVDWSLDDERLKSRDIEWFASPDGRVFVRPIKKRPPTFNAEAPKKLEAPKKESSWKSETAKCPVCGAVAYAQPVCPNCAKGRAGIRIQWICGEDADHVFYTE